MTDRPEYAWNRSKAGHLFLRRWPKTHQCQQIATVYRRADGASYGFHVAGKQRDETIALPDEASAIEACYRALNWQF